MDDSSGDTATRSEAAAHRSSVPGGDDASGSADRGGDVPALPDDFEVLVVGPSHGGGIVRYIDQQTRHLAGHVTVSVYDSGAPPTGAGSLRFVYGIALALVALFRFPFRSEPDVVHVHTSHHFSFYRKGTYVLLANLVWDVPVILHVHGSGFDEFVRTDSPVVGAYQRIVFRTCDDVVVLSEYWRDVVSARAAASKIRVVPNAIDPESFQPDPTDERPHLVFVSNLIERKGVEEFATAVERLADRRPGEFAVSIAGDGPLSDRVERLAAEYDEVTYHGYVSEEKKRRLLRDGSVYVLTTYAEGLPIAMLEGMAGANAVVSTDVAAIPEVVDRDRGILIEPVDVDELVAALDELIASPDERERLAENSRRTVEEAYSWQTVTEELLRIYAAHA